MLRRTLILTATGLLLLLPISSFALTIFQKLNFDLVRAFPACAGPGTCSSLPLNEPGTASCPTVSGTQQPYAFDDGQVQFRVSSGALKVQITLHGVINGNGNTVNSAVENWGVVAKIRRIGDASWFGYPNPSYAYGVTLEDISQEVMTFPVVSGAANLERTAEIAYPPYPPTNFDLTGVEVLEVSVLDPAGCVMARNGVVID